ncbi:MAG TPA: hypothetical protein VL171_04520 [Verrucomicrobiae bacterium]|nr:hypothetical protein [Verrucomicrobiae bacterium]
MNELLKFVVYGLIGGFIAHWFDSRNKAIERRRAFRDQIHHIIMTDPAIDEEGPLLSRLRECQELKEAYLKVREDIVWWRRRRFSRALDKLIRGEPSELIVRDSGSPVSDQEAAQQQADEWKRDMDTGNAVIAELLRAAK